MRSAVFKLRNCESLTHDAAVQQASTRVLDALDDVEFFTLFNYQFAVVNEIRAELRLR